MLHTEISLFLDKKYHQEILLEPVMIEGITTVHVLLSMLIVQYFTVGLQHKDMLYETLFSARGNKICMLCCILHGPYCTLGFH